MTFVVVPPPPPPVVSLCPHAAVRSAKPRVPIVNFATFFTCKAPLSLLRHRGQLAALGCERAPPHAGRARFSLHQKLGQCAGTGPRSTKAPSLVVQPSMISY